MLDAWSLGGGGEVVLGRRRRRLIRGRRWRLIRGGGGVWRRRDCAAPFLRSEGEKEAVRGGRKERAQLGRKAATRLGIDPLLFFSVFQSYPLKMDGQIRFGTSHY